MKTLTKTMIEAIETLRMAGELPYARGQKGFNINSVSALVDRGIIVIATPGHAGPNGYVIGTVKLAAGY